MVVLCLSCVLLLVALRKESVDRNTDITSAQAWTVYRSLSARRAWIEMFRLPRPLLKRVVALRKESVDRNMESMRTIAQNTMSLSARRAWIEILKQLLLKTLKASLSARRAWIEMENSGTQADPAKCRSPQGERG